MSIVAKKIQSITVDPKMRDYSKEQLFIKKMEIAKSFVKKTGISPKPKKAK